MDVHEFVMKSRLRKERQGHDARKGILTLLGNKILFSFSKGKRKGKFRLLVSLPAGS